MRLYLGCVIKVQCGAERKPALRRVESAGLDTVQQGKGGCAAVAQRQRGFAAGSAECQDLRPAGVRSMSERRRDIA